MTDWSQIILALLVFVAIVQGSLVTYKGKKMQDTKKDVSKDTLKDWFFSLAIAAIMGYSLAVVFVNTL